MGTLHNQSVVLIQIPGRRWNGDRFPPKCKLYSTKSIPSGGFHNKAINHSGRGTQSGGQTSYLFRRQEGSASSRGESQLLPPPGPESLPGHARAPAPLSIPRDFSPDPLTPDCPVPLQTGSSDPCEGTVLARPRPWDLDPNVRSTEPARVLLLKAQGSAALGEGNKAVTGLVPAPSGEGRQAPSLRDLTDWGGQQKTELHSQPMEVRLGKPAWRRGQLSWRQDTPGRS